MIYSGAHGEPLNHVVVISGGSGYNDLVGATPRAIYVLPGTYIDHVRLTQYRTMAVRSGY